MTEILMIVGGDYTKDTRVLKEKLALEEYGHKVYTLDHKEKARNTVVRVIEILVVTFLLVVKSRKIKFDVVHAHDFDMLPAGICISRLRDVELVYDAHEMYSYMVGIKWLRLVEDFFLRYVDRLIVVDIGTFNYFDSMTDKPITVIENCKDIITYDYVEPVENDFILIYIGSLSPQRMFPEIIDYIGETGVLFAVAGRESDVCYNDVKRRAEKYTNVLFLGEIPNDEVIARTHEANAVICMFNPANLNCKYGIPNKLYESLVCGRPIIVTKDTFLGSMVSTLKCGVEAQYSKDGVQNAVKKLANDSTSCRAYGKSGLRAAIGQYNWEKEKQKLCEVYK